MRRRELARHTHMCPDYIKKKSSSLRNSSMVTHTLHLCCHAQEVAWHLGHQPSRALALHQPVDVQHVAAGAPPVALQQVGVPGEGPASSSTSMPAWD